MGVNEQMRQVFSLFRRRLTYLNGKLIDQWHLHDETYQDAYAPKITSLNIRHTYNQFRILLRYFVSF